MPGLEEGKNTPVRPITARLSHLTLPARWTVVGAASAGVIGAIVGLVVGLRVYAPTAPFAVVELGLPAAIVGGVIGFTAGLIVTASRRIKKNDTHSP